MDITEFYTFNFIENVNKKNKNLKKIWFIKFVIITNNQSNLKKGYSYEQVFHVACNCS